VGSVLIFKSLRHACSYFNCQVNYNLDVWLNAVIPDPDNLDPSTRCLVQKLKRRKPVDSSGDDPNDIKKGVRFARVCSIVYMHSSYFSRTHDILCENDINIP
jgi:hypothetical protein